MKKGHTIRSYRTLVKRRLNRLRPILSRVAHGDFSHNVRVDTHEDDFKSIYAGIQLMIKSVRDTIAHLNKRNTNLKQKVRTLRSEVLERKKMELNKNEFIAFLGHELRNPLASVLYAAQLIRLQMRAGTLEHVEEEVRVIEHQSEHMARLIQDLTDVSRIARGKIELERQPIDLKETLHRAIQTMEPHIAEKNHHFSAVLPEQTLRAFADPMRIEQIVTNLLGNAIRYTEAGGIIELTLDTIDSMARIRVKDNGQGISSRSLKKIFDVFFQVNAQEHGLGMGLAIARGLARMHGGDVVASSGGIGKGSEFVCTIPLLKS